MGDIILDGARARDFAEWLCELDHGAVNQRLSEKLLQLGSAVQETGLAGTLTIKVSIKREGDMAKADVQVKADVPEHPMHGSLFFFGRSGSLHRDDPRQLSLRDLAPPKLKDADKDKKE